jgi:hypothetical protein
MKAMADRSRGHRGAIIKRKKSHKIVGVVQNRPVVAGEGIVEIALAWITPFTGVSMMAI